MFPIISYGVSTGNAVKQKLASGNWQKGFRRKSLYLAVPSIPSI